MRDQQEKWRGCSDYRQSLIDMVDAFLEKATLIRTGFSQNRLGKLWFCPMFPPYFSIHVQNELRASIPKQYADGHFHQKQKKQYIFSKKIIIGMQEVKRKKKQWMINKMHCIRCLFDAKSNKKKTSTVQNFQLLLLRMSMAGIFNC